MVKRKHLELIGSITYDQEKNNIERSITKFTRNQQRYLPREFRKIKLVRYNDIHTETQHADSLHKARQKALGLQRCISRKCYCDHVYCKHQVSEDKPDDHSHKYYLFSGTETNNPKTTFDKSPLDICHPGVSWHRLSGHEKVETVIKLTKTSSDNKLY